MFELLDIVRVKKEYPELSLTPNHIGTIVDIHNGGEAYTVEFIDENLETIEEALYREFAESELEKATIIHGLDLPMALSDQAMNVIKRLPKYDPYICDDRQSIDWETFRNMTDEQFEQHIENLRNKEKTEKITYCKAVVKLIDYYGFEYIKDKIKESFYAVEENGDRYRYYFCFEGNKRMRTFKARYREWSAYAIIDVDKETYETTIVEYQLP